MTALNWSLSDADGKPMDIRSIHAHAMWRAASGYVTKGGKSKWRVTRHFLPPIAAPDGRSGFEEAKGRDGRVRLFDSYAAANDVADEMRAGEPALFLRYILKCETGTADLPEGCTAYALLRANGRHALRLVTDPAGARRALEGLGLESISAAQYHRMTEGKTAREVGA